MNKFYQKIQKKCKKTGNIDYSGMFFHALFLFRDYMNVFLKNRIINFVCRLKGVKLGKNVIFNGRPIIHRYPNSSIVIGDGCIINSAFHSSKIGLQQPSAFVTLNENAKITLGNNTGVSGLKIAARSNVTIGNNVLIGVGCTIFDNDAHNSDLKKREQNIIPSRPVIIEDNVFIGLQSIILKGVRIGKNAVIGARSVVTNNIPENSIAIGNPCKIIIRKK